jgi:homeobox protein cut-like
MSTQEKLQARCALRAREIPKLTSYLSFKAREIEQLRQSLKGYADYDEIKRELEIMKVEIN